MHTEEKDLGDPGVEHVCKCMDCASARQDRYVREIIQGRKAAKTRMVDQIIKQDANAQQVIREVTREIEEILAEYDESDTIVGQLIMEKLTSYHHAY